MASSTRPPTTLPPTPHPDWLRVAVRMESCARSECYAGYAMMTITVMVDKRGVPCLWLEPDFRRIEPKYADAMKALACAAGQQGT